MVGNHPQGFTVRDQALSVEYRSVGSLKSYSQNARTHSKHQIRQIAGSIGEFGFINPVLVDSTDRIIAGHGRVAAAKLLGMEQVPTIRVENLTTDQIRAYVLADNKLAENAGWDKSILAIELQHLLNIDTEFDITVTGFEIPEIDLLLSPEDGKTDGDDVFEVEDGEPITQLGDLWNLGKHRILCGDASDESSYPKLLNTKRAEVAFIDPPYNVRIKGNVSGNGAIRHREFPMASGDMGGAEFIAFLISILKLLARYSKLGSVHFVCMDWRHMGELIAASKQVYDELLNVCVWVKNNGGMGSFYRSRHELVFVFRNGKGKHRNNIQLGKFGRNRTNVWEYPSINSVSKSSDEGNLLALHPTVKPVRLVADALLDCSARGDWVLDTFLGSGTTLLAAERTGRICCGVELDPIYVDTAIKRWQRHTGDQAVHAVSGKRFDDVTNERLEATHG
ncbi:MAG: site-specific DNA-methyltransferase [Acidobacteriaceae bacterium]